MDDMIRGLASQSSQAFDRFFTNVGSFSPQYAHVQTVTVTTVTFTNHIQQNLFVSFYNSLPEVTSTTVRFFNRIDYYTVHGPDAAFASKEVFRSVLFVKKITCGSTSLDSVVLNKLQFESFVRDLLLIKHYRVEVYTKPLKAANNAWTLEFKGSPGNLSQFEEVLFSGSELVEGSAILAVRPANDNKSKVVGVAMVDTIDHTFYICEFADDDYYSNLESLVIQNTPKECLLPSDVNPCVESIKKVMERSKLLITSRKRSEFSADDASQDLNRLVRFEEGQQQNINALAESKLTTAISALVAIIRYLELCGDQENFGQFRLVVMESSRFVQLDAAAVSALNLLPLPNAAPHQRSHSLLGLLDKCRTPHGHRLLAQWVKQPLRDLAVINERHEVVETLVADTELRQGLYEDHLRRMPDFQVLSNRLLRKKATLQDLYRIYQGLQRIPALINLLENNPNPTLKGLLISPINELSVDTKGLVEMVESTLDLSIIDKGEFLIKPDFDDDLKELRQKMDSFEHDINKTVQEAARELSLEPAKTIKLELNSQYGYYFRVTLKDEKMIRNVKGYEILDATKSGVRFRSEKLNELNDYYKETRDEYAKQQESIVDEMIAVAGGYRSALQSLSQVIAQLDVLVSLATVAVNAPVPYVRPLMRESAAGVFTLKQARHPCLEVQDSISYIANDVNFRQGECMFYMVTGPNMGGKSTYIRSAGVVALMAHIGSLVPCASAEISILDSILARVGASDSQVKGMSTFMVEMVETSSIIRTASQNSLVIIDELGRGTSTFEGCGIAWAIAEYLALTAKSFTLFATHFHELTRLSETVPTLSNQHVTAITQEDSLTLLYQVQPGVCDQSFGIHVASIARFPQHVIEVAKRKLAELEDYQSIIVADSDMKKRKIIQDGERLMGEIIKECKTMTTQGLSDSELESEVTRMKQRALQHDNVYLRALLCKD